MASTNPSNFDEDALLKNIKEIIEEKPKLVVKLLFIFMTKKEDLFKRWLNKDS